MNEQQFNPQENAQHSSYNPNPGNPDPNAGAQQQAGGYNPQGNPNPGNPNAGNPNPGQQSHYSGQQPPPDPQKMAEDQFANELKQAYAEYERVTASADSIGKRDEIKPEVVENIKKSAKAKLERKIAEATERFSARTAGQGFANAYANYHQGKSYPSTKVYRSGHDKMIAGVCGGLAEFFGIDSTWVRLFFVLTTCFYLVGLIAYIVLSVILPVKTSTGEFRKMF
jgi:phage shock protein PspC (stress-responsive transcriptional regulator)